METENLDKFIEQNREEFDVFEPSPDIWNAIQRKTENDSSGESKVIVFEWRKFASRVAVVLAIFFASYYVHEFLDDDTVILVEHEEQQRDSIPEILRDFQETQTYYGFQVSNKMDELEKYAEKYPDLVAELKSEIIELDDEFKSLTGDLSENVNNEEIIQAMIQNYRIKLRILEKVMYIINDNEGKQLEAESSHEL